MRLALAFVLPALLLAALAPSLRLAPLRAQEPRPGGELAPFAGLLAFDQDFRVPDGLVLRGLKDAAVFGGRLGYTFGRRVGIEGSVSYSTQTLDPSERTSPATLEVAYLAYTAEALGYLATGAVVPFVAAGVGGLSFDVEAGGGDADESSSGLLATLGGGLKLPLAPSVLLRVDARDILVRQGARGVESLFGGEGAVLHNIGLSAGLALRFGGPGDQDGDGVYDDRDTCPGTVPGAPVDDFGCVPEVPPEPPPVRTDADKDGVSDALDDCPDTPAGSVVDLDGCPVADGGTSSETDR